MKINIKDILEGIKNSVFVKEEVEKVAEHRYSICKTCPRFSGNSNKPELFKPGPYYSTLRPDEHCTVCACNIHAKVRSLHTSCPEDKWEAVATKEEAAKIYMATDENKDNI